VDKKIKINLELLEKVLKNVSFELDYHYDGGSLVELSSKILELNIEVGKALAEAK
jgi:hypothetical protein